MPTNNDWDRSNLTNYLQYDTWKPSNAMRVLAGLDYYPPEKESMPESALCNKWLGSVNAGKESLPQMMGINTDYFRKLEIMESNVKRLANFWHSGKLDDEPRSPRFFIEWALSKQFCPDWLDWAIEHSLYKQETDDIAPHLFDKESTTYPPELDIALQAWRAVSATEGKGKPKARIKAWLDANTKLSKEAKERIAIVANWEKTGGATRTG